MVPALNPEVNDLFLLEAHQKPTCPAGSRTQGDQPHTFQNGRATVHRYLKQVGA
jgi:hypothetical protein